MDFRYVGDLTVQRWSSLTLRVTPEAMTDSKFLCYINKASQRIDNFNVIVLITNATMYREAGARLQVF